MITEPIQLNLNSLEELFGSPGANPFDLSSRYISGVDEIVSRLKLYDFRLGRALGTGGDLFV